MHSRPNFTLAILLVLAFFGFHFAEAERIRASVITMLIEITKKRWPGQKELHLNPHFAMNPVCYQILFAIESLNNSMNSTVLGCRSQPTLNNGNSALIYLAVSPTELNFDSGHETVATGERGNLLIELEKVLTKHFEISSHHIRIQPEARTSYVQAQRMRAYLEKDGSNFSSRTNDWTKSYKREAAIFITLLLKEMDLRYPLIRTSMRTEKGTSFLYADVDLWFDVMEIDELTPEAIISLSNEISEASNRKTKLGSFEEGREENKMELTTNFRSTTEQSGFNKLIQDLGNTVDANPNLVNMVISTTTTPVMNEKWETFVTEPSEKHSSIAVSGSSLQMAVQTPTSPVTAEGESSEAVMVHKFSMQIPIFGRVAGKASEHVDTEPELGPELGNTTDEGVHPKDSTLSAIDSLAINADKYTIQPMSDIGIASFSVQGNTSPNPNDEKTQNADQTTNASGKYDKISWYAFVLVILTLNYPLLR